MFFDGFFCLHDMASLSISKETEEHSNLVVNATFHTSIIGPQATYVLGTVKLPYYRMKS